ncbi:MAG: hypothetical protein R3F55_17855 [Alphaproteobacteria bacterium]
MASTPDSAKDTQEKLEADIAKLREELSSLSRSVKEVIQPQVKQRVNRVRDAAVDVAEDMQSRAREYGEAAAASVRDSVRTHPMAAMGIAFVAGALAAILLRR